MLQIYFSLVDGKIYNGRDEFILFSAEYLVLGPEQMLHKYMLWNTCKPMAVSFQCMTKSTTIKKKKEKKYMLCK